MKCKTEHIGRMYMDCKFSRACVFVFSAVSSFLVFSVNFSVGICHAFYEFGGVTDFLLTLVE